MYNSLFVIFYDTIMGRSPRAHRVATAESKEPRGFHTGLEIWGKGNTPTFCAYHIWSIVSSVFVIQLYSSEFLFSYHSCYYKGDSLSYSYYLVFL